MIVGLFFHITVQNGMQSGIHLCTNVHCTLCIHKQSLFFPFCSCVLCIFVLFPYGYILWGSCTTSRFSIDFLFLPEKPAIRCWANSILKSTSEPFLWIPPLRFITEYYESIHHCTVQNKMKNVYHAFLLSRPTEYFIWSWSCLSTLFIYLLYSLAAWGWVRLSTLRPCLSGDGYLLTRITKSAQERHWVFVLPNWSS